MIADSKLICKPGVALFTALLSKAQLVVRSGADASPADLDHWYVTKLSQAQKLIYAGTRLSRTYFLSSYLIYQDYSPRPQRRKQLSAPAHT